MKVNYILFVEVHFFSVHWFVWLPKKIYNILQLICVLSYIKKMKKLVFVFVFLCFTCLISSCNFNKSINKDLITGMTTRGDGLSVEEVYITIHEEETSETSFVYGEMFHINFNDIQGFVEVEGEVYPGMELTVLETNRDTVLHSKDVYANQNGVSHNPLLLLSKLTVANPMKSNASYELHIRIWDKKGEGSFSAELDFDILPDEKINTMANGITADNIYLFDDLTRSVITNGQVKFENKVFMIFENIDGFKTENGMAHLAMRMKALDAQGQLIYHNDDLLNNRPNSVSDINKQLAASLVFPRGELTNPVTWLVEIWDRKSNANLTSEIKIVVGESK